jgi:hypothetical protein
VRAASFGELATGEPFAMTGREMPKIGRSNNKAWFKR